MVFIGSIKDTGFSLMDEVSSMLMSNEIYRGMESLILGMRSIRQNFASNLWKDFALETFQEHSLSSLIYQDPFARHSSSKPRGYAGDAELIDFVYGKKKLSGEVTSLGKDIFEYFMDTPGSKSVRARRDILAEIIDQCAFLTPHPIQILSVACGHLREAQQSKAVQSKKVGKLIALDQDLLSLNLVKEELGNYPIQIVPSSVAALVRNKLIFEDLDLIYSTGLYDYLSQPFAQRLTKVLFNMLRPGGRLLIANFIPDHREVGYMETFLQWHLVYRDEEELIDIASEIAPSEIAKQRTFLEENGNICFLELIKAEK